MTESLRAWRLDASGVTWVFAGEGDGLPCCLHWGAALPAEEDLEALATALRPALPKARLDVRAPLSLSPEHRRGWFGHPGLMLRTQDGPLDPLFRLEGVDVAPDRLVWTARDPRRGLALTLTAALNPQTGVLVANTALETDRPLAVDWLPAPVLPIPDDHDEILEFAGRWTGEFQPQRAKLRVGAHMRESREGRTGHASPPYAAFLTPTTNMTEGRALGIQLAWSGGHRLVVEEEPDGRRQVQMGAALRAGEVRLAPGQSVASPTLVAAVSTQGLGGLARAFHRHIRRSVVRFPDPQRPRPVHYNCWEAIYFAHDPAVLKEIASRAAALGAERFVLDDGWFRGRSDDDRALGDWTVDPIRYPDGLGPLIAHVEGLGMRFGLWVEPEMISADSALYAEHPDWVLGGAVQDQPSGRRQYVLDKAKPEVAEHIFVRLDALLTEYPIDYLKWDHNRPLVGATAAQARAVDRLLGRVRAAHPHVEIESCSGGGGRIDLGILAHTHRVWLSDSNDALVRLTMQHWASLMLPPEVTGSHAGPRVSHTSGRELAMGFRAWVAAQRHMGYEFDPRELTGPEALTVARVTAWWKANRDWLLSGDLYPLDPPDPAVIAELHLASDGGRFVVFAGQVTESARSVPRGVRLAGLDPAARYRIRLTNRDDASGQAVADPAGLTGAGAEGLVLSGAALMHRGLAMPAGFPATLWVIEGERLSG